MTLSLLWFEYKAEHPDGVQYSWFCERYRAWVQHIDVVMRQEHRAGEKLFVDYAGQSMPVINRETGELREAQIFVAVLGASNYPMDRSRGRVVLLDHLLSASEVSVCREADIEESVQMTARNTPLANTTKPQPCSTTELAVVPRKY